MSRFNFADIYRSAGVSPGREIISRRLEVFDRVRSKLNSKMVIDMIRFYFGLTVSSGAEWFREAFEENDASFSMHQNEREIAILSACLLTAALEDGKASACLALLTTAAAGNRMPLVHPELVSYARQALYEKSINSRPTKVESLMPASTQKRKAIGEVGVLNPGPSLQEASASARSTSNQTRKLFEDLAWQVKYLREEVEILWWHIGGWSRLLEKPFSELDDALAATMAGLDLADLTQSPVGPAAAPAILHRTIGAGRKTVAEKITIMAAVDAFPRDAFARLELGEKLARLPDICPILTAFLKASDVGESPAWHNTFKNAAKLEPQAIFGPLDMATQVFRERLLLSRLD